MRSAAQAYTLDRLMPRFSPTTPLPDGIQDQAARFSHHYHFCSRIRIIRIYSHSDFKRLEEFIVAIPSSWQRAVPLIGFAVLFSACASGTKVTRVQDVPDKADVPYKKVLVVSLFSSFDSRNYIEKELIKQLADQGTNAVGSLSMMDSRTNATRQTYIDMVDQVGADAVVVIQLKNLETDAKLVDANPQATYNVWPTYYYNVWNVQLTEYVEPPGVMFKNKITMATQVYSVGLKEPVWGIESQFKIVQDIDGSWDYSVFIEQAKVISSNMRSDGLIAR